MSLIIEVHHEPRCMSRGNQLIIDQDDLDNYGVYIYNDELQLRHQLGKFDGAPVFGKRTIKECQRDAAEAFAKLWCVLLNIPLHNIQFISVQDTELAKELRLKLQVEKEAEKALLEERIKTLNGSAS